MLASSDMAKARIQGRGVMIVFYAQLRMLGTEHSGYDDLMRIMESDVVEVETGDLVCLHIGFRGLSLSDIGWHRPLIPMVIRW